MSKRDLLTIDLFDMVIVPVARTPKPGALDINMQFRHVLSDEIKKSPLSRHQIAARMSELLGHEVTKHQLDSGTAESRDGWRFPLEYLPALEVAVETHEVLTWLAGIRGAKLAVGREALETQLGKLEHMKGELRKQEAAIKKLLGGQE
ncbi:hypothetical protein [Methylobacter tundripaludum]|uniref:hypothetical protein n=1 Tax=Methylobacter tundripaludum TaxID=173365 RepID=UPI000564BB7C|nr:hypothetical protein [Methylobacter tundripaludum]